MKNKLTCINYRSKRMAIFKITFLLFASLLIQNLSYAQNLKFIAYGDSRSYASTHDQICTQMNSENPQLIIHSGDLWDGYASSTWVNHFTSKTNLNNLLNQNKILVARGNHESETEVLNLSPSFVKNNSITYSFREGNVFFVCLGMSASATMLENELKKPEALSADFRVIYHHYPIYSTGNYSYSGNAAVEAICDQYQVTLSFCGHDHNYHRTKIMYGQQAVYSGTNVPSNIQGTTYIVTGGAGAPLYSAATKSFTDKVANTNHYCVLTTTSTTLTMVVKDKNGTVLETFVRNKPTSTNIYHPLTISATSNGSISQDPAPNASGEHLEGTTVTLTANGNAGYALDYWTGDVTGSANPTTIVMNGAKTVGAVFKVVPTYSLTASVATAGQGTVSPTSGTYNQGETATITATPAAGYEFDHWSGDVTGTQNPINVTMNSNKNVVANFILIPPSIGYKDIGTSSTTTANRRAIPLVMPENGIINSISMYHNGGTGNMILAVYDGTTTQPGNRIAVTPSTPVSSTTGWQKINLETPVQVSANQNIFLAWVYENNPGVYYYSGTPGRVDAGVGWASGMPTTWGSTATQTNYLYNIYANYTPSTGNEAPVAVINGPYSGTVNNAISFSSAGSNDPDGSITSYAWNFGDGSTSTLTNPTHTYTSAGTYTATLVVTDNNGLSSAQASTTVSVTTVPNEVPVAVVNGPYSGTTNSAVTFSSVGSNDPDGSITSYAWNFGDGGTSTAANPSHTYTTIGTYNVSLTVTDNQGAQSVAASTTATITADPVTCDASACDGNVSLNLVTDRYGSETTWTLKNEAGTIVEQGSGYANSQTVTLNWNLTEGKYTFTINDSYGDGICCSYGNGSYTLTDGCNNTLKTGGNFGSSETTTICVPGGGVNQPPVAVVNGPYTGDANVAVSFSSAGSNDPDGSISSYAWNFGDGGTSTLANPTHTYTTAGTYTVSLTVTDNRGETGSSSTTATITQFIPVLTSISVTPENLTLTVNSSQQFSAQGYDQNNNPMNATYNWSATGGTIDANGLYTAGSTGGNYAVTATSGNVSGSSSFVVVDGGGCTAPQYVENGGYSDGSRVYNNGVEYECKPYPYSGWCDGAAWAYEPGVGAYWTNAWTEVGPCLKGTSAFAELTNEVQVYPNPFSAKATILLTLTEESDTEIKVYNASGQIVLNQNHESLIKGEHVLEFDGSHLPAGLYLYKIRVNNNVYTGNLLKK